jgi:hypothetical protein
MGHRAKHLRRNWIPERVKAAEARAKVEAKRQDDARTARLMAEVDAEVEAMGQAG